MDDVAAAIADPVRRRILEMLRAERLPAGRIAEEFAISRPAISRHLRVLRESGLVTDSVEGRHRVYGLEPARLAPLAEWMATLTRPTGWDHAMDALDTEVHRTRRSRRSPSVDNDREDRIA